MKRTFFMYGAVAVMLYFITGGLSPANGYTLVEDGQAKAVLVPAGEDYVATAKLLQDYVAQSTGVTLPIVAADQTLPEPEMTPIYIGWQPQWRELFQLPDALPAETSVIIANEAGLLLSGDDAVGCTTGQAPSPSTRWSAYRFLEDRLGVRWLWPGEVGTYVPRKSTLLIEPQQWIEQQQLLRRRFRTLFSRRNRETQIRLLTPEQFQQVQAEAQAWLDHHRMGEHTDLTFGHAFGDWWERYHQEHPEYFAVLPEGDDQPFGPQPFPNEHRVKLNVSLPAVSDQVVQQWLDAGMPQDWNVCPNDSSAFCICQACRQLDGDLTSPVQDVVRGKTNLTGRYVDFWNRIITAMRKHRPDAVINTYAYSAYRFPPTDQQLQPGIILQVVDGYDKVSRQRWDQWIERGATGIMLRPNWWYAGGIAPHLPLEQTGRFFSHVLHNGMLGFDFDSLHGFWATQGLNYYLIARMAQRPDLDTQAIIDEYCAAFGDAAPTVRQYFNYWQQWSDRIYPEVPAGGSVHQKPDSLFARTVRKHGLSQYPLKSNWQVIPYLYTDPVLAPAKKLLAQAAEQTREQPQAAARVAFLQAGLEHLRLTRDVLAVGMGIKTDVNAQQFQAMVDNLDDQRRQWTQRHVVWGEMARWLTDRYRLPMRPENVNLKELNLDGM